MSTGLPTVPEPVAILVDDKRLPLLDMTDVEPPLSHLPDADAANAEIQDDNSDAAADTKMEHTDGEGQPESPSPDKVKPVFDPILYDIEPSPTADATLRKQVEIERLKQLERQKRFAAETGEDYKPPRITETSVLGARRAAVRRGFATGYDTQSPEEEQKRMARIARFGPPDQPSEPPYEDRRSVTARSRRFGPNAVSDAAKLSSGPTLEVRRNPEPGEVPRLNALQLFGVDHLATKDVVLHFKGYGPSWCEWLNDSSCNLAFEDHFTLRRVLRGMSLTELPDAELSPTAAGATSPSDSMTDVNPATSMDMVDSERIASYLTWRPLRPFGFRKRVIPLWARMATDRDVRPEKPNPKSRWSRTVQKHRESPDTRSKAESSVPSPSPSPRKGSNGDKGNPRKSSDRLGVKMDASISKGRVKKQIKMEIDTTEGTT